MTPPQVEVPRWMFDHVGERFMVRLTPDGKADIDGGHSDAAGVRQAMVLHERIATIRKPGSRYAMVTVEEIPDVPVSVNERAIATLNSIAGER